MVAVSFICSALFAQHKITGVVKNQNTKNPIEYVSIGIKGKNVGTVSTEKGNFEMNIGNEFMGDSLLFSCIGYSHAR